MASRFAPTRSWQLNEGSLDHLSELRFRTSYSHFAPTLAPVQIVDGHVPNGLMGPATIQAVLPITTRIVELRTSSADAFSA